MKLKFNVKHTYKDINKFIFAYFVKPDSLNLQDYKGEGVVSSVVDRGDGTWKRDEPTSTLTVVLTPAPSTSSTSNNQYPLSRWNSIIAVKEGDGDTKYLSMFYWDTVISGNISDRLNIIYNADIKIIADDKGSNITEDYIVHTRESMSAQSNEIMAEHPYLRTYVAGWTTGQAKPSKLKTSEPSRQMLSNVSTSTPHTNPSSSGNFTDAIKVKTKPTHLKCIPSGVKGDAKLVTTLRGGAYLVTLEGKNVKFNGRQSFSVPFPEGKNFQECEIHTWGINTVIFYFKNTYECYVSNRNQTLSGYDWGTPWKVFSQNTCRIILPSYFSIFPFAFLYYEENFYLIHVKGFREGFNLSNSSQNLPISQGFTYDKYYTSSETVVNLAPLPKFFENVFYLYPYFFDEVRGYTYKEGIVNYAFRQLSITFSTFMQALRESEDDNVKFELLDCGVLRRSTGKSTFYLYSPYTSPVPKGVVPKITLPADVKIDNMLALYNVGNKYKIVNLSLKQYETIEASDVQIRNGVKVMKVTSGGSYE